ncbi:D-Ala-D-Ala carboxypeptidase family metallohydrolase [Lysobacter fragariae]
MTAVCTCARAPTPHERYERWLSAGHREPVAAYNGYLRNRGAGDVVPMEQLLRSGRRWQRCDMDEFSLPPRKDWSSIVPTLALVRDLMAAGAIRQPIVASGWRNEHVNRCNGGSPQSRHLRNNALDFDIAGDAGGVARLCDYWRRYGARVGFGLGFYSATRIHVDTSGFRTWGGDHRRGSSLCITLEKGGAP